MRNIFFAKVLKVSTEIEFESGRFKCNKTLLGQIGTVSLSNDDDTDDSEAVSLSGKSEDDEALLLMVTPTLTVLDCLRRKLQKNVQTPKNV